MRMQVLLAGMSLFVLIHFLVIGRPLYILAFLSTLCPNILRLIGGGSKSGA